MLCNLDGGDDENGGQLKLGYEQLKEICKSNPLR